MLWYFYFGFFVLLVSSCGPAVVEEPKNKTTEVKAEIPMPLFSDDMVFADEFVIAKKFFNGDNILHAQSKADWAEAKKMECLFGVILIPSIRRCTIQRILYY